MSVWGNPRLKETRVRFNAYLKKLKNADSFLADDRSVMFVKMLPKTFRDKLYKKLREIDPMGYNKVWSAAKSFGKRNILAKQVALTRAVKGDMAAVNTAIDCATSPTLVKLIPMGGLKNILAMCLAAGYSRDAVAAMAKIDPAMLNTMVTEADIKAAAVDMPKAIAHLANGIVMKDLMAGLATQTTEIADRIAQRRVKVAVDVSRETRERSKFDVEVEQKRDDETAKRFGVNRQEGTVLDADSKPQ
jgi:hypothetical protein